VLVVTVEQVLLLLHSQAQVAVVGAREVQATVAEVQAAQEEEEASALRVLLLVALAALAAEAAVALDVAGQTFQVAEAA
jgi:hypothetical protein